MQGKQKHQISSFILLFILVGAGLLGSFVKQPVGNNLNQVADQTIVFEDGNSVDIHVDGNVTTMTFSDGSRIVVNATVGKSIIEFWENVEFNNFTRVTIEQQKDLLPYPYPFEKETPTKTTSVQFEIVEVTSGKTMSSWEFLTAPSFNDSYPSVTQIRGMADNGNSIKTFETAVAKNATHSGTRISTTDSAIPTEILQMELSSMVPSPNNVTLRIMDQNGTDSSAPEITTGLNQNPPFDSFFDMKVPLNMSGRLQDHALIGTTNEITGTTSSYSNITSGFSDLQAIEPGLPPLALRYPSPSYFDDPAIPYDVLDVILMDGAISVEFGGISIALYLDKMIINYFTWTGEYIPIVILFEVWEVHISIYEVSIIIYLQMVELVMVIVVYEIIKIEVYVSYTVIVIEVLQITLIQITIIHVDIDIVIINIEITINVWIFKIIVKVVKKVIVIVPLWIMIIPIFIPVPVPVFIPVPTPVPVPVLQTDVDLYDQSIDEASSTMNLTYFVSDEYGNPLSGASVSLTMSTRTGTTYTGTEITGMPGYYQFTNLPLDSPTTITVTADLGVTYRPIGTLTHSFSLSGVTVVVPSNVTQTQTTTQFVSTTVTVTNNNTVTNNSTQATGTSPVPLHTWVIISTIMFMTIITTRKKKALK